MSEDPNIQILPKRGGQPGNINALRHGYYAKNLGVASPTTLDEFEIRNLAGEAAMLKDYMFKLYNCNIESTDSATLAETLRALSLAGMALARILHVHTRIRPSRETGSSLSDAIDELNELCSNTRIP